MVDLYSSSILDLLPPNLAKDPQVIMEAKALDQELQEIIAKIPGVSILPRIGELTDNLLLDLLAWQFHVDFYDQMLSVELKRELILKSLDWHLRKGTPVAVEEIISTCFENGEVIEWFDYGGRPGYFKVLSYNPKIANEQVAEFLRLLEIVKRKSAWLDGIIITLTGRMYLNAGMVYQEGGREVHPLGLEGG